MGQGLRESRRSLGLGYLASFLHLCQCHDLIVVGEAATILAMGKQLHAHWRFQKRGVGDCVFFFFKVSLSSHSHPINFPCALSDCLYGSPTPRRHFYKSSSFNILTITPSSLSLLTSFCPHFFLPVSFSLSVCDGHVSWGKTVGRMQACCHGNKNPPSP